MSFWKKIKKILFGSLDIEMIKYLSNHYFFSSSINKFYKIKKNKWNIDIVVVSGNSFCNGDVYKYVLIHCKDNTYKVYCIEKTHIYWILRELNIKNKVIIDYNPSLITKQDKPFMELVYDSYNNLTTSANNL